MIYEAIQENRLSVSFIEVVYRITNVFGTN